MAARPWMACGSPARHAPTGSGVTAVSRASGRLAKARNASSCAPAGVAASAPTINLRRTNRIRNTSQGTTTPSVGGAATANASTTASQLAVESRLWPAPAISRAALLAAVSWVADGAADQRDVVGAVAGRLQAVGDTVSTALDLTTYRGDRRHRAVDSQADEHPDETPDDDDGVAEQLSHQSARSVGVGDEPRLHTSIPAQCLSLGRLSRAPARSVRRARPLAATRAGLLRGPYWPASSPG